MPVPEKVGRRTLIAAMAMSTVFGIISLTAPVVTGTAQAADKKAASQPATAHKGCDKYNKSSKEYTDCMNTN